jgi:hypothetical protein
VRYARDRLAGLDETGNQGAAPKYGLAEQTRILALLDQPPPAGYSNWTAPLLARALCDVHEQYIWRFLRAQKIDLSGRKSWCESANPEFAAKAAEIVGLYMAPPENAVVLSPDPQARNVGDTPYPALSPGRALLLAFPPAGRLPSTISAADLWSALFEASQVLCSRPTPRLFHDGFASSASRRGPAPPWRFGRDEVSQVPSRSLHT